MEDLKWIKISQTFTANIWYDELLFYENELSLWRNNYWRKPLLNNIMKMAPLSSEMIFCSQISSHFIQWCLNNMHFKKLAERKIIYKLVTILDLSNFFWYTL